MRWHVSHEMGGTLRYREEIRREVYEWFDSASAGVLVINSAGKLNLR